MMIVRTLPTSRIRPKREPAADEAEVAASNAAEELPGLPAVVEGDRQRTRAYSSERMRYSISVAGVSTKARRSHTMIASPMARPSTATAPHAIAGISLAAMGPRMICSSTIGIDSAMTATASALAAPPTRRQTNGRTKGLRRHSAAAVDRDDEGEEELCGEVEEDMSLR